ncbi:MAG: oligosaccharide flippase family protein [candidate division Zixibacteria bacterium]|nr:oligosaccharide flippase family protein [candidate division Zixibacteria bacterium]
MQESNTGIRREETIPIKAGDGEVGSRSRGRRILRSFGFLTAGRTLADGFNFLYFVVLSRNFGGEGIGQYSFAMGLTGFFAVFADFGLYELSIKELSRQDGSLGTHYGPILILRLGLTVVVLGVLLAILPLIPVSHETKLLFALIGAFQVMQMLIVGAMAVFIAREDTHLAAIIEISTKVFLALAVTVVVIAGGRLVTAVATLPVITAGQILVTHRLVTRKYGRPQLTISLSQMIQTMHQALPYGLSGFLNQVYTRVDVVFLGFFLGATAAGIYNVSYRVVFLLKFIPQIAAISFFPLASKLYQSSRKDLEIFYRKSVRLIVILGLPFSAGLWLIAPDLIEVLFGETFAESVPVLRILAGFLFLTFVSRALGVFLMSCDRQVERTKSHWKVACLNVLANLVLISVFHEKGAAIAVLISEACLVSLFALRLRPVLGWPNIGSRLVIGSIGAASFCLPFTLFHSFPLGVVIPASVLLYSLTLVMFKETRRNEIRGLLKPFKVKWEHIKSEGLRTS